MNPVQQAPVSCTVPLSLARLGTVNLHSMAALHPIRHAQAPDTRTITAIVTQG